MRIVYLGTGEIGLPSLRFLLEDPANEVVGVVTQPDQKVGRRQVLTPPRVKIIAESAGIPVFQPRKLGHNETILDYLRELEADLFVVMAYGQILPDLVIEIPGIACVNLHASLLPRHRGASPVQAAIRDGDTETGITLMHIVRALDAGDMIHKETIPILDSDTGGSLHDKLAELGPTALRNGIPRIGSVREPQDESLVTYAPKLLRDDGRIDWDRSSGAVERLIRAYDPWPGAFTTWEGAKLKLFPGAEPGPETRRPPGEVFYGESGDPIVSCGGETSLRFGPAAAWQLEGRRRLAVPDFLRGSPIAEGSRFS